jgi:hypothetical protein
MDEGRHASAFIHSASDGVGAASNIRSVTPEQAPRFIYPPSAVQAIFDTTRISGCSTQSATGIATTAISAMPISFGKAA